MWMAKAKPAGAGIAQDGPEAELHGLKALELRSARVLPPLVSDECSLATSTVMDA